MELTVLGMNGPFPAPGSGCSGYLLTAGNTAIQLDLGCGTLARLTGMTPPEDLTALVFSHWHSDHCSDVLPLIYRMASVAARRGADFRPLPVYGPEDESSPVRREVQQCPQMELHTVRPGDAWTLGTVEVQAFAARHPVPALMYRLESAGKCLAFTGDTNITEDLPALAKDADLLLADGLFPEAAWGAQKPHLSAKLCAELARDAGAKRLVLTHLNPEFDPETLLREAKSIDPGAELAKIGLTCRL